MLYWTWIKFIIIVKIQFSKGLLGRETAIQTKVKRICHPCRLMEKFKLLWSILCEKSNSTTYKLCNTILENQLYFKLCSLDIFKVISVYMEIKHMNIRINDVQKNILNPLIFTNIRLILKINTKTIFQQNTFNDISVKDLSRSSRRLMHQWVIMFRSTMNLVATKYFIYILIQFFI